MNWGERYICTGPQEQEQGPVASIFQWLSNDMEGNLTETLRTRNSQSKQTIQARTAVSATNTNSSNT